ncbi:hypothetical protein [Humisphaera borealis]|uniref:CcoQ/FixQ family Cbb3-type cytochrome c oxidase assembly chaperone n=1 Tax=Humisphaera borealis TaxID=2807512 RepID=A0A7M2WS96_9BACT|nr:hypothetical protein [Humisphaera borealis]QOV88405.1 hypothetical protein IPV69_19430 [Humisphaera borealis]
MTLAIMYKESFQALDLTSLGVTALVIFFVTFISMAIWAAAQQREDIRRWSALPLAEDGVASKQVQGQAKEERR